MESKVKYYSEKEEKINVWSHFIGLVLSVIALTFLVIKTSLYDDVWHIVSFSIYGASMVLLYLASTLYHGTYTPYTLVTLNGTTGWIVFGIIWGAAIIGVVLKLFFIGKYDKLSTIMYVVMGWVMIFAIKPLIENLSKEGLIWLALGGIFYTVGAIYYSRNKMPYNHAVFHVFVLLGSFCHFVSIFFYV